MYRCFKSISYPGVFHHIFIVSWTKLTRIDKCYMCFRNAKSNREGIDEISSDNTSKKTKDDYIDYIRASALIYLFEILNDMDRNSLGTILGTKTRVITLIYSNFIW
jgi:hypothetical protein